MEKGDGYVCHFDSIREKVPFSNFRRVTISNNRRKDLDLHITPIGLRLVRSNL